MSSDEYEDNENENEETVTCAVVIEFTEPGSAQLRPRIVGGVTPPQMLLAAAYLRLMAEQEIHRLWTARTQQQALESAQLAQLQEMMKQ